METKLLFAPGKRLDNIDLSQFISTELPKSVLVNRRIILDAIHTYWNFGISNNGINPIDFLDAYSYLFKVRSYNPIGWANNKSEWIGTDESGNKKKFTKLYTTEEMLSCCFDRHYEGSILPMPVDKFLSLVKTGREEVVNNYYQQIINYIEVMKMKDVNVIPKGQQLPLRPYSTDVRGILIDPEPYKLAELLLVSRKNFRKPKRNKHVR